MVKNPPAMQETCIHSLGWEDPLEKEVYIVGTIGHIICKRFLPLSSLSFGLFLVSFAVQKLLS